MMDLTNPEKKSGLITIFENLHDITNNQIYYFIHILTDGHTSIQEKYRDNWKKLPISTDSDLIRKVNKMFTVHK